MSSPKQDLPFFSAPECVKTTQTEGANVWSFGILCWQIARVAFGLKGDQSIVTAALPNLQYVTSLLRNFHGFI